MLVRSHGVGQKVNASMNNIHNMTRHEFAASYYVNRALSKPLVGGLGSRLMKEITQA